MPPPPRLLSLQFGWWTLKYDNAAKPHAFLCVARFFREFPTPEKIMLQVWGGCLLFCGVSLCCRTVEGGDCAAGGGGFSV